MSVRLPAKVIGLVSAGHFVSHFYLLLLPPLFPLLRDVYHVGYTELGFAISVMSISSALTQTPVGFLVDRYGATRILVAGIVVHALAIASVGLFPYFTALLVLMVVCGVSNAIYHPADYAILSASVDQRYMGRAFSIHTATGFLGTAVAPVTVVGLTTLVDWRVAVMMCSAVGLLIAALIAGNAGVLQQVTRPDESSTSTQGHGSVRLLLSLPMVMGLLFYTGIAMSGQGISSFSVSSLHLIYELPITEVTIALSAFLFASPVGVLLGGWLADRTSRHELNVAACFAISASLVFAVGGLDLSLNTVVVLLALAGLCVGIVAPSRDMLIRAVTPPGDVGKVFGFVTTGFNIGGIAAPVAYGYLLDTGEPRLVFWATGLLWLVTIATVLVTGQVGRRARAVH